MKFAEWLHVEKPVPEKRELLVVHITADESWSGDEMLKKFITEILYLKGGKQWVVLLNSFVESTNASDESKEVWTDLLKAWDTENDNTDRCVGDIYIPTTCGILPEDPETSQANLSEPEFNLRVV